MDGYDLDEFIRTAALRGICSRAIARAYTLTHLKTEYTEDDFIECYRFAEYRISSHNNNRKEDEGYD